MSSERWTQRHRDRRGQRHRRVEPFAAALTTGKATAAPSMRRSSASGAWTPSSPTPASSMSRRSRSSRRMAGTRCWRSCSRAPSSSPSTPGRSWSAAGTGASSRSPQCTGSSPRPSLRPSTASWAWRRWRSRGQTRASRRTALCPGFVRTPFVEKQIGDQALGHDLPRSASSRTSSSSRKRSSA
jgi:hypothetical protein